MPRVLFLAALLTALLAAPAQGQPVSPRVDQRRVAVEEAAIRDAPEGNVVVRLRRGAPVLAAPASQDGPWIAVDYIDPDTLAFAHGWARAEELSDPAPLVLRDPASGAVPRFEGACTERRTLSGGGAVCLGIARADLRCRRSFDPEGSGVEGCDLDLEVVLETDSASPVAPRVSFSCEAGVDYDLVSAESRPAGSLREHRTAQGSVTGYQARTTARLRLDFPLSGGGGNARPIAARLANVECRIVLVSEG